VGRFLRYRFHQFTSACPELLHDLALLQSTPPHHFLCLWVGCGWGVHTPPPNTLET
jgi:hypothetical protein